MRLSEIIPLVLESKYEIRERECSRCREYPCPDTCRNAQKSEALQKAADLLELLKTLEPSKKENTHE